jgi:ABC-type multidrug transport system fused ATPase/permease subunit
MSVASVIGGFAEAGTLLVIARIAFALASGDDQVRISTGILGTIHVSLTLLLVLAGGLVLVRAALQWLSTITAAKASADVMLETRRTFIRLLLGASWPLHASQREGRAQELVVGYAAGAAGAVGWLSGLITSSFSLAAMLVAAFVASPFAALGAAVAALLIGFMLRPLRAAVRRRSGRRAQANLELGTGVTEFAAALQEVRIFGVESQVAARIDALSLDAFHADLRSSYVTGVIPVLYQAVAMLLVVGGLGIAFGASLSGLASLGAVVLIMIRSLTYAQGVQSNIQGLHAAAPYLETLQEEEDRYRAAAVPRDGRALDHIGELAFESVSFEYEPGVPVLHDVSFTVPPGEIVGIVGPSGAGKSTLVQLLLRLRDPTVGVVRSDGADVRELSVDDWYRRLTFVAQEARLLTGSVADNIRFYRDDVDEAAIERAAKLAHIHDDIISWPRGYDTPVGERGSQLSGGQRQRLCIARALVGKPDVIVLDEPTSALDVKSEALMRDTMQELAPDTTVFVIAHRLSTLSICNRIMVILNGELQGFDEPAKLEAANPFYREALRLSGLR